MAEAYNAYSVNDDYEDDEEEEVELVHANESMSIATADPVYGELEDES